MTKKKEYIHDPNTWSTKQRCLCPRGCALAMSIINTIVPSQAVYIHKIKQTEETVNTLFPTITSLVTPLDMDRFVQLTDN